MTDPIEPVGATDDDSLSEGGGTGVAVIILVIALLALAGYFVLHHLRR